MLIQRDINSLLNNSKNFESFDQSRLTILGGTGFIGKWLIESLDLIASELNLDFGLTLLTRDQVRARANFVELSKISINFIEFDFSHGPTVLPYSDYFINGATPSRLATGLADSVGVYSSTINATESIIKSATVYKNIPRVVNLSSGIVYGSQGMDVRNQAELDISILVDSPSGYLNSKIHAEYLLSQASEGGLIENISPRLFAFLGPGVALNEHFAVGNFLRDALMGKRIEVQGNPETRRSYMYPTDLVNWLFLALGRPVDAAFNMGSEVPISMSDLATLISKTTSGKDVVFKNPLVAANNYVPSTSNFRKEYKVEETISLAEGLDRWLEWLRINFKN